MVSIPSEAEAILRERFGKDNVIALATTEEAVPQVRYVNAYYEDGAFYVVTHALSNKEAAGRQSRRGHCRRLVHRPRHRA